MDGQHVEKNDMYNNYHAGIRCYVGIVSVSG